MNKSGLSSVVATVLLLLLTVAAMATLSGILIPFVKERLYSSTDCSKYEDSFSFVEKINNTNYNCYIDTSYDHAVSITAKEGINETDLNLKGFQISFQSRSVQGGSKVFELTRTSGTDGTQSWMLGKEAYFYPEGGEIASYVFTLDKIYNFAEVRAILANGKVCKSSDSIEITKCGAGINLKIAI